MAPGRGDSCFAVRLLVPDGLEEAAVAAFWDVGSLGVQVFAAARSRRNSRVALHAYFPGRFSRPALQRRIAAALRRSGIAVARPVPMRTVTAGRWVEAWQRTLKPMRIGRRFIVVPEGVAIPSGGGRLPIRVRFGQAFGTGEHATTRMSLRLIEAHLQRGDRVIDLGTGTGILSIAAHRMGARSVLAVDDDPVALQVARDTLRDNGLQGAVRLWLGDAGRSCGRGPFDLALVNIGATVIERILPRLAAALAPGGRAVLTGLLIDDARAIVGQARPLGLRLRRSLRSGAWSALLLEHPPGP